MLPQVSFMCDAMELKRGGRLIEMATEQMNARGQSIMLWWVV